MKMLQLLLKSLVKKVTLLWVQTLLDSLKLQMQCQLKVLFN